MDLRQTEYSEKALVKTKIIATVGPACQTQEQLRQLVEAGVDVFRLNFAHAASPLRDELLQSIRNVSEELERPIATLGDLAGPKIRLGELPEDGVQCVQGETFEFVREPDPLDFRRLTCTYDRLIDDLAPGDRLMLADGTVSMRVVEKSENGARVSCKVEQPGVIRTRQGVNLPGVALSTPSLTEKDDDDLKWALDNGIDYIGLSFVRSAADVSLLLKRIEEHGVDPPPQVIAKIEKMEAVADLDDILDVADAVMVARGDLGVEVDVARVPTLQKRIVRLCNQHRIPVITATQMLDSMQQNERPTRAEASDVANAVLDGSDAVMLSGETAIGVRPVRAVEMMSRISAEAERLVTSTRSGDTSSTAENRARLVTEAVTLGAATAAEHLEADLIVVATRSGRTAMAVSKQRSPVPILALTDNEHSARRMCLYWGVTPVVTDVVRKGVERLTEFVVEWGQSQNVLRSGSRFVVVASSNWDEPGKDLMQVHAVP